MKGASRLGLFVKGLCMGIADVIPGVSGGTMALILGIYRPFIEAIKSVNPRPIGPLLRWAGSGFKADRRAPFVEALGTIHLGFLIPLVLGIGIAIGVGSAVIPSLLERFPELMRGLFFGLILASVYVPYRLMPKDNRTGILIATAIAVVTGIGGYAVTDPNLIVNTTSEWVAVEVPKTDEAMTLKEAIRRGPSSMTAEQVYWAEPNAGLRGAIAQSAPETAKKLDEAHQAATGVVVTDKSAAKERELPYNDVVVPAGTVIQVPRPSFLFIFFAGAIAICAMVLPGISGSFILLILNCYYFILNALKGTARQLLSGEVPVDSLVYIALFLSGLMVGILSFSRLLSWLLHRHPAPTMGALIGLMLGCLRGIWPYQQTIDGQLVNLVPSQWGTMEIGAVVAAALGIGIVVALTKIGDRLEQREAAAQAGSEEP